jgi:hypothetical protein
MEYHILVGPSLVAAPPSQHRYQAVFSFNSLRVKINPPHVPSSY